jgi:ATP-binding cassette subfamily F protein 3
VSHDRHLLDACADRLWLVADGQVQAFDGDLDDYRRRVLSDRSEEGIERAARKKTPKRPRKEAGSASAKPTELKPLRQRMERAEAEMARLTKEIEKIDAALAQDGLFTRDPAKAATLGKSRAEHAGALAKAEEEWLEAGAALQAATG